MAPVRTGLDIPDLAFSSLELDSRTSIRQQHSGIDDGVAMQLGRRDTLSPSSLLETGSTLSGRSQPTDTKNPNPAAGSVAPDAFNNRGIQALFALIGASFVIGAIWFFFWAKNGGFQWRKGDWEDYKSTVLRRKGPNGTTLSNATKSTRLGGGSVVGQGYSDHDSATFTEVSSELTTMKEKARKKKSKKKSSNHNAKDRKMEEVKQAGWEGGHDNDVRAYRHERAARVGGLNTHSEALHYGTDYSDADPSVAPPPPRHATNTQSRQASPEKRDRNTSRRDFSYSQDKTFSSTPSQPQKPARYHPSSKESPRTSRVSGMPGSWSDPLEFDVQSQHTKSYHHPIPGLTGQGRTGGGFRRGRDELDD